MITIKRLYLDDCTIGIMYVGDFRSFTCFTLELPWNRNEENTSCVPSGVYSYFKRRSPKTGQQVLELRDVEDRTNIQIHSGNFISQIQGCILVGDSIRLMDSDNIPDVANSRKTLSELFKHSGNQGFITIE